MMMGKISNAISRPFATIRAVPARAFAVRGWTHRRPVRRIAAWTAEPAF